MPKSEFASLPRNVYWSPALLKRVEAYLQDVHPGKKLSAWVQDLAAEKIRPWEKEQKESEIMRKVAGV